MSLTGTSLCALRLIKSAIYARVQYIRLLALIFEKIYWSVM